MWKINAKFYRKLEGGPKYAYKYIMGWNHMSKMAASWCVKSWEWVLECPHLSLLFSIRISCIAPDLILIIQWLDEKDMK